MRCANILFFSPKLLSLATIFTLGVAKTFQVFSFFLHHASIYKCKVFFNFNFKLKAGSILKADDIHWPDNAELP